VTEHDPAGPGDGEVSSHLQRVVIVIFRLGKDFSTDNLFSIDMDHWHTPHLGERAFQPKSPVKTSLLIEEHLQLAVRLTQPMSGTLWRSKRNHHHSCPSFRDLLQGGLQRGNVLASRTSSKEAEEDEVEAFLLPSNRLLQDMAKVCRKIGSGVDEEGA